MSGKRNSRRGLASRREFLAATTAAAAAANLAHVGGVHAGGADEIKVGLVGCGGRGNGAALDALSADPAVKVVAVADVFDKGEKGVHNAVRALTARGQKIDHVFIGFDAYKKLVEVDLDYVIIATPPHFKPAQIEAAVKAGKHVFAEKPVAVDPPGARSVMEMGKLAREKGLSFAAGTQRRHQLPYLEMYKRVQDGQIGPIVAARCYWNQGQLWYRDRSDPQHPELKTCSDMELMIRDWVNWTWLSGDHIVEQHVHNIDVVNWFLSKDGTAAHPQRAVGMGGRARRVTGDQYDYFAVDFEYDRDVHCGSYCRQVNDTASNVSETLVGENGVATTSHGPLRIEGPNAWRFGREKYTNPYVQEHKDLIDSIRNKKGLNEANNVATSTLTAIMGRIAAYTGREVTWDEMMSSDLRMGPKEYNWEVALFPREIPLPGKA